MMGLKGDKCIEALTAENNGLQDLVEWTPDTAACDIYISNSAISNRPWMPALVSPE